MKSNNKTKYKNSLTRSIILKFIITLIIFTFALIAISLFCLYIIETSTWHGDELLYIILKPISDYYYFVLLLFWVIGFIIIAIHYIRKILKYMDELIDACNTLVATNDDLISLSPALLREQQQLNNIKQESIRNALIAKEAESKKNDLIVYMAHDLKTPLTSIIGYLSLLNDEDDISRKLQKKYVGIALDKSQRLEDLINEFFEITRFNLYTIALNKQNINLSYMLEQLVDECYLMLNSKELTCNLDIQKNIYINADSDKLARVFDNLLKNAINYSYENTEISILLNSTDNDVEISFKNCADKIPDHKLEKIFEKFYRLDDSRMSSSGGAGLGLAIAKEIVELHNGTISVESNNNFTEFIVSLPKGIL